MPKIGLFLGAGASRPFGLPTVEEFFERVDWDREGSGRGYRSATEKLARRIWIARGGSGACLFPRFNSEWLFEYLQKIVDVERVMGIGWNISYCTSQELLNFLKREVINMFNQTPADTSSAYLSLVTRLYEEIGIRGPLKIFTTNYDLIIESSFRSPNVNQLNVQFVDGFTRNHEHEPRVFNGNEYQCNEQERESNTLRRIELYKLHGSITWNWDSNRRTVVDLGRAQPTEHNQLLYPGYKGVPTLGDDTFWFLRQELTRVLTCAAPRLENRRGTTAHSTFWFLYRKLQEALADYELFIVIGFRFYDEYIRELFSWALHSPCTYPQRTLKIIVVIPDRRDVLLQDHPNMDYLEMPFGENNFTDRLIEKIREILPRRQNTL